MLAEIQDGFIDVGGIQLYYQQAGTGAPIVFVHGWSLDSSYWSAQLAFFAAQGRRAVAYDWRGMGRSAGAQPAYAFSDLVQELGGVLAALGIDRPILCGHSQGGNIVLDYALSVPQGLSALVLADTPGSGSPFFDPRVADAFDAVVDVLRVVEPDSPLSPLAPVFERLLWSASFRQAHPEVIAAWNAQFVSNSIPGVKNGLGALANSTAQSGSGVLVPTLLIHGSDDALVPASEMRAYERNITNSTYNSITGSGHMTPDEQPATFNADLASFLASASIQEAT